MSRATQALLCCVDVCWVPLSALCSGAGWAYKLRMSYLSDGLYTLITRTFNDLEISRVGLGRAEKLVKLSDLVDFFKGEIFPYAVFPDKEPCVQTTIVKEHTLILSVAEFLGPSNRSSRPWNTGQKAYQKIVRTMADQDRMDKLQLWTHCRGPSVENACIGML